MDRIKEIQEILSRELPDDPEEALGMMKEVEKLHAELDTIAPKITFCNSIEYLINRENLFSLDHLLCLIEKVCKTTRTKHNIPYPIEQKD